jgi:putative addiction module component, TIGR02574 family
VCVSRRSVIRAEFEALYINDYTSTKTINEDLAHRVLFIQLPCMGNPAFDYRSLSVADRLQLVGDIWDSIAEDANAAPDVLPLTDEQKEELDRRVADYVADPSTGVPIDEALGRIRAKFRRSK